MRKLRTEQRGQRNPSQDSEQQEVIRFDRRLLTGLDEDSVNEFNGRFKDSRPVREAILRVLTKELEGAILQSESRDRLLGPNALADHQDLMGYRRGLRQAIKLLTDKDANDN